MPSVSEYMVLIGKERIVSLINAGGELPPGGTGVLVPETLEQNLYVKYPGVPQKGNKKIVVMVKIPVLDPGEGPAPVPEDFDMVLKVKVPAGIISAPGLQKFTLTDPPAATDTPELSYYPQVKLIPQNAQCYLKYPFATPKLASGDPVAQTVDVTIMTDLNSTPGPKAKKDAFVLFLVEVDWSHSTPN